MLGIKHARRHDRMQAVAGVSLAGSQELDGGTHSLGILHIFHRYFCDSLTVDIFKVDLLAGYQGGQVRLELLQDVNGETQSSIIVDCKQITFPYTLDVTGAPGVSEGTLYVSEVVDGTIQQLGQYPLTFKKAE